jgi:hypothetical protein
MTTQKKTDSSKQASLLRWLAEHHSCNQDMLPAKVKFRVEGNSEDDAQQAERMLRDVNIQSHTISPNGTDISELANQRYVASEPAEAIAYITPQETSPGSPSLHQWYVAADPADVSAFLASQQEAIEAFKAAYGTSRRSGMDYEKLVAIEEIRKECDLARRKGHGKRPHTSC